LIIADDSPSGRPRVAFACGIWHDEERALKPAYRATAVVSYTAKTRAVDFRNKVGTDQ
jgi:serpin B